MDNIVIDIEKVKQVETSFTKDSFDGLRIRTSKKDDNRTKIEDLPWAFPLLPKVFQSVPQVGDAVLIFRSNEGSDKSGNRYYIGPIISQPQNFKEHNYKAATSLLSSKELKPLERISDNDDTSGAFPKVNDTAIVGRGQEDIILRYTSDDKKGNVDDVSEIDIRAGIRKEPTNNDNPNMVGNIIFNGTDPAYIQLKYKNALATEEKNRANSIINLVADKVNIMSNQDELIKDSIHDKNTLVKESDVDSIMNKLHPLPKGDKLVELLEIMIGAIMHHVHPWAGMEQCGDWSGYIERLKGWTVEDILSEHVRIS